MSRLAEFARGPIYALAFLTRLPMPSITFAPDALALASPYFPLAGLIVGSIASAVHLLAGSHLPAALTSLFTLLTIVLVTGALHEDGLADAADGFGGGLRDRARILEIMRDSRIGSYGALALLFSIGARWALLLSLPAGNFVAWLISAHVLCRWTSLPLAHWLASARPAGHGMGSQVAGQISSGSLFVGSAIAAAIVIPLLEAQAWAPGIAAVLITGLSGRFYFVRIGGVTGDCFGATNQLVEIAVLCCGVWAR